LGTSSGAPAPLGGLQGRSTETKYARIPLWLYETGVSLQAIATYGWLHGRYGHYERVMPSYSTLAKQLGVSRGSVITYVKALISVGALRIETSGAVDHSSNSYLIAFNEPFEVGPETGTGQQTDQQLVSGLTRAGQQTDQAGQRAVHEEDVLKKTTQTLSPSVPEQPAPAVAAVKAERETEPTTRKTTDGAGGLVQQLAHQHQVQLADIEAVLAAVQREGRIRSVRAWAGSDTGRADIADRLDQARRTQASRVAAGTLGSPEALDALSGVDDRPECACGALLTVNQESCGRCRDQQTESQIGPGFQEFRAVRDRVRHDSR
jgi:hypothetical protein